MVMMVTVVEGAGAGVERAVVETVLYSPVQNGGYVTQSYKLSGSFSPCGTAVSAEGRIIQLHPLGLCNSNDYDELYDYGWVGVVKLERPELEPEPCLSVFGKVKRAMQRGATAVVLDITDNPVAAERLSAATDILGRPVVVMRGPDAAKLMGVVNTQSEARIRIIHSPRGGHEEQSAEITESEYFGMGIFVAVFLLFCLLCVIVMLKLKWRHRERQLSVTNLAKQMIARLDTRQYQREPSASAAASSSQHHHNHHHSHYNHNHHHNHSQRKRGAASAAGAGAGATTPHSLHAPGGGALPGGGPTRPSSDASTVQSSNSESCAICLEGYREAQVLRVLPCHHEFHQVCVDPWLEAHGTCPLCKIHIAAHIRLPPDDDEDDDDDEDVVVEDSNPIREVAIAFHPHPSYLDSDHAGNDDDDDDDDVDAADDDDDNDGDDDFQQRGRSGGRRRRKRRSSPLPPPSVAPASSHRSFRSSSASASAAAAAAASSTAITSSSHPHPHPHPHYPYYHPYTQPQQHQQHHHHHHQQQQQQQQQPPCSTVLHVYSSSAGEEGGTSDVSLVRVHGRFQPFRHRVLPRHQRHHHRGPHYINCCCCCCLCLCLCLCRRPGAVPPLPLPLPLFLFLLFLYVLRMRSVNQFWEYAENVRGGGGGSGGGFAGSHRDVREYMTTSRRDAAPSSGRRNVAALSWREEGGGGGGSSGFAGGSGSGGGVIRPIPLSPCIPYHSGIPFTPALVSGQHVLCGSGGAGGGGGGEETPLGCTGHRRHVFLASSTGHAPARLYGPRTRAGVGGGGGGGGGGGAALQDPRQWDKWGSLRTFSVTAMKGLFDSNRSTYGSTDPKDSSDVSSYDDSRVYQGAGKVAGGGGGGGGGSRREERGEKRKVKSSSSPVVPPPPPPHPRPTRAVTAGKPSSSTSASASARRKLCGVPPHHRATVTKVADEAFVTHRDQDKVVIVHEGSSQDIQCAACARRTTTTTTTTSRRPSRPGALPGDLETTNTTAAPGTGVRRTTTNPVKCDLDPKNIPHDGGLEKNPPEKRSRRGNNNNRQDVKRNRHEVTASVMMDDDDDDDDDDDNDDVTTAAGSERAGLDTGPLLFSARPPKPRPPADHHPGLDPRRTRSASCRRHHPHHPAHHQPLVRSRGSFSSRSLVHTPSRARAAHHAPSGSGRHLRSVHGSPHSSSNAATATTSSQRPSGHSSGSSRRTSSGSRRYQWAVEQRAGPPPLTPTVTGRHAHHQQQQQHHHRPSHNQHHCEVCSRQGDPPQQPSNTARVHARAGGGGGGGRGGSGGGGGGYRKEQGDSLLVSDGSNATTRGHTCRQCHRRGGRSSSSNNNNSNSNGSVPKHSMVVFTQPQGAVVTIPLGDTDHYQPVNAV
ncbi:uncharacterized protein LOC143287922 [Babylonia areolata]|uniref:uncharacterized protein LOC143287922 n=1 Tax=Babylonia areolata TaxID=304850 RepID=UPI003FD1F36C